MDYEGQLISMHNELEAMREELDRAILQRKQKTDECEEWRRKYTRIETEMREKDSLLIEYENKIALLSQEVERLGSMLKKKDTELNQLKAEIQRLNSILDENEYTLNEMQTKITRYEVQIKDFGRKDQRIMELENQVAMLTQEIERLNSMLKKAKSDLENYTKRFVNI